MTSVNIHDYDYAFRRLMVDSEKVFICIDQNTTLILTRDRLAELNRVIGDVLTATAPEVIGDPSFVPEVV